MQELNNIKISIIVPIYKYHDYFEDCLESLVNQKTNYRYEILLESFGSDEKIIEIIQRYEREFPSLISSTIHKVNYGVSVSRNDGIYKARGEYICFVDNDDNISDDFIEYLVNKTKKYPNAEMISYGYYSNTLLKILTPFKSFYHGEGKKVLKHFFNKINLKYQVYCWLRVYKTDFLKNNKILFPSDLNIYEDWPFFAMAFYKAKEVKFFSKQVYHYIHRKGSAIHRRRDSLFYNLNAIKHVRDYLYKEDEKFASTIFKKISKEMKLHMLLVSYQSKELYHMTTKELYKEAKLKLKDIYKGKEMDYGPKKIS